MFVQEDITLWENEQNDRPVFAKMHYDPRRSKTREYRKGMKSVHYNKECTEARRDDNRKYRVQMKRLMRSGKYEWLRGYQRTGGRITW